MAREYTHPAEAQEKTQGDKLDNAVEGILDKPTGLAQDPSKDSERKPADEPLK